MRKFPLFRVYYYKGHQFRCLGVCAVVKDNINGFNFVNGLNISQFVACRRGKNLVMLYWGQLDISKRNCELSLAQSNV